MTPTNWLMVMLGITLLIYSGTAVAYHFAGRPGMMIAFVGYVIANAGLILDALTMKSN